MATDFFPQRPNAHPMIYAYEDTNPQYQGLLKVGYTAIDVDKRVAQQYPTKRPDGSVPYRIVYRESAMYPDGSSFTDHDVHRVLKRKQITGMGGEWFRCTVNDVRAAVLAVKNHTANVENRVNSFSMRPEQQEAVDKTAAYFQSAYEEDSTRYPKFLWNCKMRFGKTFASYQLAKRMGFKRILILTFKPAVVSAWQEDLNSHIDFEGWQFISRNAELTYETADKSRPIVCFGSFQDYLGVNKETGGIKAKTSGYIPPTGIWLSLTSTTSEHGRIQPKSCLSRRTRTATTVRIWISMTVATPMMKRFSPSQQCIICICPVRRFGR